VIKPPAVANDKILDPQPTPPIRASTHEAAMSTSLLFLLHSSSSLENPCDLNILTLPSVSEAAPVYKFLLQCPQHSHRSDQIQSLGGCFPT